MIKLIIKDDDDAVAVAVVVAVAFAADNNDDDDANDNAGFVAPPPAAPLLVPALAWSARLGWSRFACCRRLHDNAQQPDRQNRQAGEGGGEMGGWAMNYATA